jgi:hypothetical protein
MIEDIDLFPLCSIHKAHFYPMQISFLSKLISVCIHIFITGELSHNIMSWPREKCPRQVLIFRDKAPIMFRILHLEALTPYKPGHTSQRFCNQIW